MSKLEDALGCLGGLLFFPVFGIWYYAVFDEGFGDPSLELVIGLGLPAIAVAAYFGMEAFADWDHRRYL